MSVPVQKMASYLDDANFVTREEAVRGILDLWRPSPPTETVSLELAAGRVCGEDIFSKNTLPVCRSAKSDGVAVRFADFANGIPDFSKWIADVDYSAADMGDDFDDAFDTVIMVENFTFDDNGKILSVSVDDDFKKGQLITHRGEMLDNDELVMMRGERINPFQIGLLAASGVKGVPVVAKPLVAYMPSGDELVKAGTTPKRGQNIETNSLMAKSLLQKWHADMVESPIVQDQESELEACLDMVLEKADIVLINGGSSMGSEDFVSDMLARRGDYCQHGVRAIPGVPVAVALVDGKPVVNLPGPPYATFCALDWCVKPLVFNWFGQPAPTRVQVKASLETGFQKRPDFEMIMRLAVHKKEDGSYSAHPIPHTVRYSDAAKSWNALLIAPIGINNYKPGAIIDAELLYTDGF